MKLMPREKPLATAGAKHLLLLFVAVAFGCSDGNSRSAQLREAQLREVISTSVQVNHLAHLHMERIGALPTPNVTDIRGKRYSELSWAETHQRINAAYREIDYRSDDNSPPKFQFYSEDGLMMLVFPGLDGDYDGSFEFYTQLIQDPSATPPKRIDPQFNPSGDGDIVFGPSDDLSASINDFATSFSLAPWRRR